MKILLCGADGFLGRHFLAALTAAGHEVIRGVRVPRRPGDIAMDYRRDLSRDDWLPRLDGIDGVINAVGILNEREPRDFERIHQRAPAALFTACADRGIGRIVQVSALGAARRDTPYLASKAAADDCLLAHSATGIVLRPSLVFGLEGASSRCFLTLASMPFLFLPAIGRPGLRPIHIDDLSTLVVRLLEAPPADRVVAAVGGSETGFGEMLATYRRAMGFPPALAAGLPEAAMAAMARLGDHLPGSLLNGATWSMLKAGSTGDPALVSRLLGHPPRSPEHFMAGRAAGSAQQEALAAWRSPLLRLVLAFLWLWSAAVSLAWPATGFALLEPFGLAGDSATLVLAGASALDAAFGLLSLARPGRRLWQAQIAVIVAYSLLVAARLPDFLIHPFAPIAKNLAVLALLFLLWAEETNP